METPHVASIDGQRVAITIGMAAGVKVGDTAQVALKTREVVDKTTGKVLEIVATETLTLRITRVGVTSDCEPATPQDAAKLTQLAGRHGRRLAARRACQTRPAEVRAPPNPRKKVRNKPEGFSFWRGRLTCLEFAAIGVQVR